MVTLEREFYLTTIRHKGAILMVRLMQNYREEEEQKQGVNIPDFLMLGLWQRRAYKEIENILLRPNGEKLFNNLYEAAWEELKERLP